MCCQGGMHPGVSWRGGYDINALYACVKLPKNV